MTNINSDLLFEKMSEKLAEAMHKFNYGNGPSQMYWNGYHMGIRELQDDIAGLINKEAFDLECNAAFAESEERWLDGEED